MYIDSPVSFAVAIPINKRSPYWPEVRKKHLRLHPFCAACGSTRYLKVHHIKPFWRHPGLELVPSNLITLCWHPETSNFCHKFVGHLGSWNKSNPDVINQATAMLAAKSN